MLPDGGLQRGERVAIYSPNCPEYAVVAHGISMAGGTLPTLNPLYRAREVVYQLADAGAKLLSSCSIIHTHAPIIAYAIMKIARRICPP